MMSSIQLVKKAMSTITHCKKSIRESTNQSDKREELLNLTDKIGRVICTIPFGAVGRY